jgi:hypothetical protein
MHHEAEDEPPGGREVEDGWLGLVIGALVVCELDPNINSTTAPHATS